jgi:hypothetical protein
MNANAEKDDHGQRNARGWMETINGYVAALECDFDRLEELRDEREGAGASVYESYDVPGKFGFTGCDADEYDSADAAQAAALAAWDAANGDELHDLTEAAGEFTSQDEARERIDESPLSIEVRSDWFSPGAAADDDARKPAEFQILLTTGGPALRIMGELDEYGQPTRAWLEYQDWGTPWTHFYVEGGTDTLLKFCNVFYFGEG